MWSLNPKNWTSCGRHGTGPWCWSSSSRSVRSIRSSSRGAACTCALVAAVWNGRLTYVAEVSRGLTAQSRAELLRRLSARRRSHPVVACPTWAYGVEPEIYCRVRFQEWTPNGRLRYPVFDGYLAPSG